MARCRHTAEGRYPVDDICRQPVSFGIITQVLRSAKLDPGLRRDDERKPAIQKPFMKNFYSPITICRTRAGTSSTGTRTWAMVSR